jgi:NADH-quinone oxidoreductase subunit L
MSHASSWILLALPAVPAFSALLLALFGGGWLTKGAYNLVGGVATAGAGLSFALALALWPAGLLGGSSAVTFDLGSWIAAGGFHAAFKFTADSASFVMVLLVTFFGFLITGYSVGYMRHDREQSRFFASINLFVASMLVLVLADNLVLIFLGWEGVGLCSYLLIGHYWNEKGVPLAAYRAFFVNRIGDILFLLGVFTVFAAFGSVSLSELSARAASSHGHAIMFAGREHLAVLAAFLLLGGAFAKSAQAPLHVWLADAMAGPTPVSALIHAATMVTAGIYLIMRLDWLYAAVPEARLIIAVCALVTLVVGAFMALTQTDIKKILAYSTLSNLALMFLALAAGSAQAAMLHLLGHAFFKALLFLSAGSVIHAAHHEQDARKLGGVLKTLPVTRIAFWVGCIGGAGLIPYLSAGFFTKEAVLESVRLATFNGFGLGVSGGVLYWIVLAVETLSALYLFRLLGYLNGEKSGPGTSTLDNTHGAAGSVTGHDDHHGAHHEMPRETSTAIRLVLITLAIASPLFALFSAGPALTAWVTAGHGHAEHIHWGHVAPFIALNIVLAGLTYFVFSSVRRRDALLSALSALGWRGHGPLDRKFWFDDLYAVIIVLPLKLLAWTLRLIVENIIIGFLYAFGLAGRTFAALASRAQTGRTHQYAAVILIFMAAAAWVLLWRRG